MAQTNELKTFITAENRQFLQSIGQAAAAAKSFGKGVENTFNKLKGFGTLLAAGAVGSLITSGYRSVDKLSASADKLGISAENFQFLEFAAKRADMEIDDLELSMRKLNLSLSRSDTAEFADAFSRLGVDAKKLKSMDIDQAFYTVISALQQLSKSEQIDIGTKIFGKNFQNMSELTKANIQELMALFKQAGGAISLTGFDKLDEQIDILTTKWDKFKRRAFMNWGGPIIDLLNRFLDARESNTNAWNQLEIQRQTLRSIQEGNPGQSAANAAKNVTSPSPYLNGITFALQKLVERFPGSTTNDDSADVASNAINSASKSMIKLTSASDAAAASLKGMNQGIASNKLKKLLGIDNVSGGDYIKSVLPDLKQITDPYFNNLLKDLQSNVAQGVGNGSGAGGFSTLNNESILASLRQRANEIIPLDGESKSGMINAVNALTETYRKAQSAQPQKVIVEIKADKDGILKAVLTSQSLQAVFTQNVKNITASEAQATTASGG